MKLTSFTAAIACLLLIACNSYEQPQDTVKTKIDSLANAFLSDSLTASIVVGIYREGSTVPEIFSYGVMDKTTNKKPDSLTIYKLGSVGKTFTATTLAWYAVNRGVRLNNTIDNVLPGQKLPFWTSGTGGDTTKISLLNL
ncbi:MAG: serine hydrolase, partial [Chitinophagaceae bacterium]